MSLRKYTKQQFEEAVKSTKSIRSCLLFLGLKASGGNYQCFHKFSKEYNISTKHFTGKGSNKGKIFGHRRNTSEYFSNKFPISSHKFRKRLIKEGFFKPICNRCGLSMWLNNLIPLELNHKNGNPLDNNLSNLELLCPNCHALTSNYRGKNIKHSNT